MLNTVIIILALVLLGGLLYFENRENQKGRLINKTVLSCLFIVAVLVQPHPVCSYFLLLLLGLLFCLGGDVLLAMPQEKAFLLGLISFLIGHLFYIGAFYHLAWTVEWLFWIGVLAVVVVSAAVYLWLRPHLGSMNLPVTIYVIVISVMLCGAWSILIDACLHPAGRVMVFIGALSFYVSDIFVARSRFMKDDFINRLLGLPLYYLGQFLLAFSVGMVG